MALVYVVIGIVVLRGLCVVEVHASTTLLLRVVWETISVLLVDFVVLRPLQGLQVADMMALATLQLENDLMVMSPGRC